MVWWLESNQLPSVRCRLGYARLAVFIANFAANLFPSSPLSFTTPKNIPCIGQRQLPASVARSHAVLALARGYSLTDRIAPGDTARLRVGVLTGH